jgi:hypothetical protein
MKTPLLAALHTKTIAGDHGLNHDGDAIVIQLHRAAKTASGGVHLRQMLLQRAKGWTKCRVAIADRPWIASKPSDRISKKR